MAADLTLKKTIRESPYPIEAAFFGFCPIEFFDAGEA
jgi:hypothetical protein